MAEFRDLTEAEQLLIELINRARLDPLGEAEIWGIDLNEGLAPGTLDGSARQVLAPNGILNAGAAAHSQWMIDTDTFSHTGENGSTPRQRSEAAGFDFDSPSSVGENITYTGSTGSIDLNELMENDHHRNLFLSAGHRENLLRDRWREVGVAQLEGVFTTTSSRTGELLDFNVGMLTENFVVSGTDIFVTGVIYGDGNGNDFYDIGEGGAGVSIAAAGTTTISAAAGGYAIALAEATATSGFVTVTLGDAVVSTDLSAGNGKLDLVDGTRIFTSRDTNITSGVSELRALGVADLNLTGAAAAETLIGNSGANILSAGAGNDTLTGGGGDDTLIGGDDFDTVTYALAQADATVTTLEDGALSVQSADGTDRLEGIERIVFSDGILELTEEGPPPQSVVDPGAGDDIVVGTAAADILNGAAGNDYMRGEVALVATALQEYAGQVYRLYEATLGRAPDAAGYLGWIEALWHGTASFSSVAAGFVNSAEFTTTYGELGDDAFVALLYQNVLGRSGSAEEISSWVALMGTGGLSRAETVTGFSESAEFKAATLPEVTAFSTEVTQSAWTDDVFRLYQATLDRAPDMGGLLSWTEILAGGTSLSSVAAGFVNSGEFQAIYGPLSDGDFIETLYQNVLGRAADEAGRAGWLDAMGDGMARADVVLGFSQSAEFQSETADALTAWARGEGGDILDGGTGDDHLMGGMLADQFLFSPESGTDIVYDLEPWDSLNLSAFDYATKAQALAQITQDGANAVFSDQGAQVTFLNIQAAAITEDMLLI